MKIGIMATGTIAGGAMLVAAELSAQTQQRDQLLEQSGFVMRAANTEQKVERIRRLPPLRFVVRNSPNGRYYLFADPVLCVCVFVGNQQAMDNYKSQIVQVPDSQLAPTQAAPANPPSSFVEIHEVDEDVFGDPMGEDILEYRF